jgi:isochorismate hydrolase
MNEYEHITCWGGGAEARNVSRKNWSKRLRPRSKNMWTCNIKRSEMWGRSSGSGWVQCPAVIKPLAPIEGTVYLNQWRDGQFSREMLKLHCHLRTEKKNLLITAVDGEVNKNHCVNCVVSNGAFVDS